VNPNDISLDDAAETQVTITYIRLHIQNKYKKLTAINIQIMSMFGIFDAINRPTILGNIKVT